MAGPFLSGGPAFSVDRGTRRVRVRVGLLAALCAVCLVASGCAKSFDGTYKLIAESGEVYEGFRVEIDGGSFRILTDGAVSATGKCTYDGGEVTLLLSAEADGAEDLPLYRGTLDGGALTLDPVTDVDTDGGGRLTLTSQFLRTEGDPAGAYRVDPFSGVEADPAYRLALADGVWTVSREGEETALQSGVYDVDGAGTLCFRPREGEDPSFVGRVEGDGLILCSNGANLRCPRIA